MMNIIEIQDNLKNFSEDQLVNEMQMPTGSVPQYLILSEINRRKRVRDSYQQQQDQQGADQTVAQEKLSAAGVPAEGIAGLAQALAPKTDMMQNTGVDPQQQMPMPDAPPPMAEAMPPMMGEEMPPEMGGGVMSMAEGGSVKRMAVGGASTNYTGQGGTLPAFLNNTQSSLASDPALQIMAERLGMSVEEYIAQMDPRSRAQNLLRVSGNEGGFDKTADDALISGLNPPLPSQEDLDLRYASDARNEAVGIGTSDRMPSPPPSDVFDSNATPIASVMQDNIPTDVGQLGTPLADLLSLDPSGIAELPDSQTGRTAGRINKAVPFDARSTSLDYDPLFEAIGVGVGEKTPTSEDPSYDNINVAGPPSLGFLSPLQQAARTEQFNDNIPSNEAPMRQGESFESLQDLAQSSGLMQEFLDADPTDASGQVRTPSLVSEFFDPSKTSYVPEEAPATAQTTENSNVPSLDLFKTEADPLKRISMPELAFPAVEEVDPDPDLDPANKSSSTSGSGSGSASTSGGGYSSVESELIDMLKQREKRAEGDKWMALAKAGMAMMASKQPSLLGAAGEAGMVGLEALEESKADYEATKMSLLAMRQKIAASRAARSSKSGLSYGNLTDIYETLIKERGDLAEKLSSGDDLLADDGTSKQDIRNALTKIELEINNVKPRLFGGNKTPIADLADKQSTQYPIAQ